LSRKDYYLGKAAEALVLAERIHDPLTRDTLSLASDSWRLLADMEDVMQLPTGWPTYRWPPE
jgi:hypothetical protein